MRAPWAVRSGLCTASGSCVDSPYLPLPYGGKSACTVVAAAGLPLTASQWELGPHDRLTVGGGAFNETDAPQDAVSTAAPDCKAASLSACAC